VSTEMVVPDIAITFSKNIKAIIRWNCNSCHGAN